MLAPAAARARSSVVLLAMAIFHAGTSGSGAQPPVVEGAVFPIATDRPPTRASLRRRFPRSRVWMRTRFGESDPSFPIRSYCVDRRVRCGLEFSLRSDGGLHGLTVRDPGFVGPAGIRVGATHPSLAAVLESDCIISLGDEVALYCDVIGQPNVRVEFTTPDLEGDPTQLDETPTATQLAAARVTSIFWSVDPT